jgi:hypothetical protein
LLALARRHAVLLGVLVVAIALRVAFSVTYQYAFFFPDSRPYVEAAATGIPSPVRPHGYSFLIQPFVQKPYIWLAIVQHVIGLVMLVVGYAFAVRRGIKPWIAAVAFIPLAVDARQLTLEHYVLTETAYVALTVGGLVALAWHDRLGWKAAALGGILLAFAASTRTTGLPIIALAGLYLLIRRVGIKPLAAFALPIVAVLGSYLVWYQSNHGVYAFGQYSGRFLYARVAPIADCDKLDLTAEERVLCTPTVPDNWDQRPDMYIWSGASPATKYYPGVEDDKILGGFANKVIRQQFGDYLLVIAEQTAWHFYPRPPIVKGAACLANWWIPPVTPGKTGCEPRLYTPVAEAKLAPPASDPGHIPGARQWHAYGEIVTTPGPLYLIGFFAAIFAAVWRPRRGSWRQAADALLFVGAGVGLLVLTVATSIFDHRYAIPAVLLVPLGLVFAISRINEVVRTPRPEGEK